MTTLSRFLQICLTAAEMCAPLASRAGGRLMCFANWVEDRRLRLEVLRIGD
jgi:hypothetical protein